MNLIPYGNLDDQDRSRNLVVAFWNKRPHRCCSRTKNHHLDPKRSLLFQNEEPSLGSLGPKGTSNIECVPGKLWKTNKFQGGGRGRRNCPKRRRHRLEHQPPCNCSSKRARRKNRRSVTGRRRRRRFFFIFFLYFSISFFVFYFGFGFFFFFSFCYFPSSSSSSYFSSSAASGSVSLGLL